MEFFKQQPIVQIMENALMHWCCKGSKAVSENLSEDLKVVRYSVDDGKCGITACVQQQMIYSQLFVCVNPKG